MTRASTTRPVGHWAFGHGRLAEALTEIRLWPARLGMSPSEATDDPQKLLASATTYPEHNGRG